MIVHGSTYITPPMRIHPSDSKKFKVFMGGSIEMGLAEDWQTELLNSTIGKPYTDKVLFFNPRRPDWNSTWEQSKNCQEFKGQVDWELDMLQTSHLILMYFDPATKSPISLLELGLFMNTDGYDQKMIVCCPEGFWRKGNVDIVCDRYGVECFNNKKAWLDEIERILNSV